MSMGEISPLIFSFTTRLGRAMVEAVDAQVFVLSVIVIPVIYGARERSRIVEMSV